MTSRLKNSHLMAVWQYDVCMSIFCSIINSNFYLTSSTSSCMFGWSRSASFIHIFKHFITNTMATESRRGRNLHFSVSSFLNTAKYLPALTSLSHFFKKTHSIINDVIRCYYLMMFEKGAFWHIFICITFPHLFLP